MTGEGGQRRRSGFWATVLAVLWSFIGVRRQRDYLRDASDLKPAQVIVAGLIGGVLFVLTIVLIVRVVIANVQP